MATAPYDIVETVLEEARVRMNDAILSLAGEILTDTAAFTQQMVNGCWRTLQETLADLKYSGSEAEIVFVKVPGSTDSDPANQSYFTYNGYFDGTTLQTAFPLPQNMIRPYDLWERPTGIGIMTDMDEQVNGLPMVVKANWNRHWEWRDDALYLPGALQAEDIRMRYAQYFSDFETVGGTTWQNQPVPIMRCLDSFADFICAEASKARADLDAQSFLDSAKDKAAKIANRDVIRAKAPDKLSMVLQMAQAAPPAQGVA